MQRIQNFFVIAAFTVGFTILIGGGLAFEYTMWKSCVNGNVAACMFLSRKH